MVDPLREDQLRRAITVWYLRDAIAGDGRDSFRRHPLLLPRRVGDPALWDFSTLRIYMPVEKLFRAGSQIEETLAPLVEMCQQHDQQMPLGEWTYDWYHLQLLDEDEGARPLCWISPELLHQHFPDDRPPVQVSERESRRPPYPRQLITMDSLRRDPPTHDDYDDQQRELWLDWLVETWQAGEEEWLERGWLSYEPARPWTRQLVFDAGGDGSASDYDADAASPPPLWRRRAGTGYPGLWWRMVPLYEETVMARVWRAMAQELFVTSVFNREAKPRQDAKLWKRLEERFALTYQRMSQYHYEIRLRELRVLQLTHEGVGLTETADRIIAEKLHPLDPTGERTARMTDDDRRLLTDSARRVVVRIRARLRAAGLISRLPAGRPRKKKG